MKKYADRKRGEVDDYKVGDLVLSQSLDDLGITLGECLGRT